jgi:hypothetical protein
MTKPVIVDNGSNPLIVVSAEDVAAWLSSLADEAGYSDRSRCAIQTKIVGADGEVISLGSPDLVLMVSNIPNSR